MNSSLGIVAFSPSEASSKRILLRLDLNSPIDPASGRISEDSRIRIHARSVREILGAGAGIAILAHQGRPGDSDFTTLEEHAERLSKYLGEPVEYLGDIIGPHALRRIERLSPGEVVVLENIRFLAEEMIEAPPEEQARRIYVSKLSRMFDLYVNDAFGAAHRSQPSIVGFPVAMRGAAGPIMVREISAASRILSEGSRPRVFVLGGAKVGDTVKMIRALARRGAADAILLTGLVSLVYQAALGRDLGAENAALLRSRGLDRLIPEAAETLRSGCKILVPRDYRVLRGDSVENVGADLLRAGGRALDIGEETLEEYRGFLREAGSIVMRGPAGYIEDPRFRWGTEALLREALGSRALVVVGGGHLGSLIPQDMLPRHGAGEGLDGSRVLVSTGGGALLSLLSGEPLPALEALRISAQRWWR